MDFDLLVSLLPRYISATGITISLTILALLFGIIGGFVVAVMRISKAKLLRSIAAVYISIVRGTPLLLQIIFVYYSLPTIGITLQPFQAAVLALSINEIAYMAEAIRGGIQAIDVGQWEAAKTLGYNGFKTMIFIIFPQAFKIIVPTLGNMAVSMIKDTSLVSTISLAELMRMAQTAYSTTFQPLETYVLAGVIYYILSCTMSFIFRMLEKGLQRK